MMRLMLRMAAAAAGAAAVSLSAAGQPYPSTYEAVPGPPTLIRGATVLTGTGERINDGDVLMVNGRIQAVGRDLQPPAGARIIDGRNHWITPGLIDVHSHLGVYAAPYVGANGDSNEMTNPITAGVWAEHSIWPQDPGFQAALAGGVTTLQILPGSANLVGGRSVAVRNVPAVGYQAMKFPEAPQGVKMACGENPKVVYGERGQTPSSRMGSIAALRQAFLDAQHYARQWERYAGELADYKKQRAGKGESKAEEGGDQNAGPPTPPKIDLKQETLMGILQGELRVHIHCYRADDMATLLDLADEFDFRIAAFHHATEAYKIADQLAAEGVCAALWADWWGFKLEAFDGIQENLALVDRPRGSCAIVHSDSAEGVQRLNQEAAKAMARGVRLGLAIPPERAIRWITANAAIALGLGDRIGTLEAGKLADVVVWNRDPFSVYALADRVFIDGALVFDREHPSPKPQSDFLLGQPSTEASP